MSKKLYTMFRLIMAVLLAGTVSVSVSSGNYIIPIFMVAAVMALLIVMRKNVVEVLADERDYQVGGKAARWAISIYAVMVFILSMLAFSQKGVQPEFEIIGSVLAYSACAIMLLYSLIFSFLDKNDKKSKGKFWFILLVIIASFLLSMISLRFISGEDTWICQDGEWVAHGHPDAPQPTNPCRR